LAERPISATPATIATRQVDSMARPGMLTEMTSPSRLTPRAMPLIGSAAVIGGSE
jgi:hypothetical protein